MGEKQVNAHLRQQRSGVAAKGVGSVRCCCQGHPQLIILQVRGVAWGIGESPVLHPCRLGVESSRVGSDWTNE